MTQTVLITGAASGIGRGLVVAYRSRGANLILVDRDESILDAAEGFAETIAVVGDVTARGTMAEAVRQGSEEFGGINIAIANAGVVVLGALESMTTDDCRKIFDVNVLGVLNTVQTTLPALRQSRGRVAIVSSASGYVAYGGAAAYTMSKFAVRGMVRQLAHEATADGVGVTHIVPGPVRTNILPGWNPVSSVSSEAAGEVIAEGIEQGKKRVIFPRHTRKEVFIARHFPNYYGRKIRNSQLSSDSPMLFRKGPNS
jgi:NAD(P)-dependent dehydrogenase (short-subunit alcohol dehydrogenase family)